MTSTRHHLRHPYKSRSEPKFKSKDPSSPLAPSRIRHGTFTRHQSKRSLDWAFAFPSDVIFITPLGIEFKIRLGTAATSKFRSAPERWLSFALSWGKPKFFWLFELHADAVHLKRVVAVSSNLSIFLSTCIVCIFCNLNIVFVCVICMHTRTLGRLDLLLCVRKKYVV